MRSLGTRRAVSIAGAATVAVVALAGCSAGQVAETANKNPSVYSVNLENSDKSVLIRGLAITYNGSAGYAQGDSAPIELNLYNETRQPITVTITSAPAPGLVSGSSVGLVGGAPTSGSAPASAGPEPTGSRPVAAPVSGPSSNAVEQPSANPSLAPTPASSGVSDAGARPAKIEIGAQNSVSFRPGDREQLIVSGLSGKLTPGGSVNLVFEFSNGAATLSAPAPVSIPFSPASRAPGLPETPGEE
jgi:hypothetical protein